MSEFVVWRKKRGNELFHEKNGTPLSGSIRNCGERLSVTPEAFAAC